VTKKWGKLAPALRIPPRLHPTDEDLSVGPGLARFSSAILGPQARELCALGWNAARGKVHDRFWRPEVHAGNVAVNVRSAPETAEKQSKRLILRGLGTSTKDHSAEAAISTVFRCLRVPSERPANRRPAAPPGLNASDHFPPEPGALPSERASRCRSRCRP